MGASLYSLVQKGWHFLPDIYDWQRNSVGLENKTETNIRQSY